VLSKVQERHQLALQAVENAVQFQKSSAAWRDEFYGGKRDEAQVRAALRSARHQFYM